ncbi:MAG TPA: hypothetical protein VIN73_08875 [Vicingaceae bacterium]
MVKSLIIILYFLFSISVLGQIPAGHSYEPENPFPIQSQQPKFMTLKDLREQQQIQYQKQNRQQKQQFGITPQPTQEQMKVDYYNQLAIAKQRKTQEFYNDLSTINNSQQLTTNVDEKYQKTIKKLRIIDTNSLAYVNHIKYYNSAYDEIVSMLSGKSELSLKRAVFVTENAYHKNKLNYEKYCKQIDNLVFVCKQIMIEKGLSFNNYMACHFVIQELFSKKFSYKNRLGKEEIFEPFSYDFIDIFGNNDQTKEFVTKLLNTKTGQCHSLPLLYLILAEELNANAYLAFAPNHSYVKFGNQYYSFNFETTNGTFVTDEWIVASGYISPTAIKNQLYLAPNTKDKAIASCLIDLANGVDFLFGKGRFTIKCAYTALNYFPNSVGAILTINNVIVAECAQLVRKYNYPDEQEIIKYPTLKKKFDEMIDFELKIERLGYIKIPEGQYEMWQQTANEMKQKKAHENAVNQLKENVGK